MNTVILGAGITGLAARHKTEGTIYEAKDYPGGLCRSYSRGNYRFDIGGGHWIFGVDKEVMDFLNAFSEFNTYQRNAGVYINKIYPYPIQSNFDIEEVINPGSMKEWLYEKFGSNLCNLFFFPFNERYTAYQYNYLAPQDEHKNPIRSSGYNTEFIYPKEGLDTLVDNLSLGSDIRYNKMAVKIDPLKKKVYFNDGEEVEYDRLISTLPLNLMCTLLGIPYGEHLPYNSTYVLNIGATPGKNYPDSHWIYIPNSESGFHRVGFYSNIDKSFAPKNRCSLYVEWAYKNTQPKITPAIKELQNWGFIKHVEVIDINDIKTAYTWSEIDSKVRDIALAKINSYGITQIGRYGKWRFQGIAESIKDGLYV